MKRLMSKLAVFAIASTALASGTVMASPASGEASTQTVALQVEGLNCAACGEAMKAQLKKMTGASDIEPQLECGRIYLELENGKSFAQGPLGFLLVSKGFNLKGVQPVERTMSDVRSAAKAGHC